MKENLIPFKDRNRMSFYFSIIFLSVFFGFVFNNIGKLIPKFDEVTGTVYGYTMDSVYVDVDWSLKYNYNERYTEYNQEDFENIVTNLMEDRIEMMLNDIPFFEYVILTEKHIVTNERGIKIMIFK